MKRCCLPLLRPFNGQDLPLKVQRWLRAVGLAFFLVFCSAARGAVTVEWDPSPSPDVVSYVLFYGTSSGSYELSNSIPSDVSSATITDLAPDTVYYLVVAAVNEAGEQSDFSNEVIYTDSVSEDLLEPLAPEEDGTLASEPEPDVTVEDDSLLATAGDGLLTLQWDPSTSPDLAGYILYYGTESRNYTLSNAVPADVTSTTVSNLVTDTVYYLTVAAVNEAGEQSEFSNEVVYTNLASGELLEPVAPEEEPLIAGTDPVVEDGTSDPVLDPATEDESTLATAGDGLLTLQWDPSTSPDLAGYILYYGTESRNYTLSNSVPADVTTATVSNLVADTVYYLAVAAVNEAGEQSEFSNEVIYTNLAGGELLGPPAPEEEDPLLVDTEVPMDDDDDMSSGSEIVPPPDFGEFTNVFEVQGIPPQMTLRQPRSSLNLKDYKNKTVWSTVVGTVGANVLLESRTDLSSLEGWQPVTNIVFSNPIYPDFSTDALPADEKVLFEAFEPAVAMVPIPASDESGAMLFRISMPETYPILADRVLKGKGYRTHSVVVRLPGITGRDLCHVADVKGFIDYDAERQEVRMEPTGESIREMAERLAADLGMNWTSASQFVYVDGVRQIIGTVVKTDSPDSDPALTDSSGELSQITIDF